LVEDFIVGKDQRRRRRLEPNERKPRARRDGTRGMPFADYRLRPAPMAARAVTLKRPLKGPSMINFIVWLIVGGLVGWIASMIMRTDAQQGVLLNIVVGIVGAAIAGWLISPLVGVPSINTGFSVGSFVVSLLGAVVLLGIVNLFRRGRVR
jgi:uncharacterized membrane protein YeaQ/YmgE (transglycosylase-associated protein family)